MNDKIFLSVFVVHYNCFQTVCYCVIMNSEGRFVWIDAHWVGEPDGFIWYEGIYKEEVQRCSTGKRQPAEIRLPQG